MNERSIYTQSDQQSQIFVHLRARCGAYSDNDNIPADQKIMLLSQLNMGILPIHQLQLNKDDHEYDHGDNLLWQEAKPALKKPPMYKVIMLNDDYSPMEFVVYVLENFFGMGTEQATKVMLQVHTEGQAICGVFTRDIAETKAEMVNQCAKDNEHPLLCEIEAADDDE